MDRDHHHHLEPGSARHLGRSASDGGRGKGFAMTGIFLHSSGEQILRQFFFSSSFVAHAAITARPK